MPYSLPVRKGQKPAMITADGLLYDGQAPIPFEEIKAFTGSDEELEVTFRDERKPLIFRIERDCGHQLVDLKVFVETHLMQTGRAVMDATRDRVINGPEFDMERVTDPYTSSLAY